MKEQPIKIFLDDLYKNDLEPKRKEKVYRICSQPYIDTYKRASLHIDTKIDVVKYGGRLDDKAFHTTKGKYERLWVHNCYILRLISQLNFTQ